MSGFNDDLMASFYLFNPLLIFTNISHSSLCFTFLFISEAISQVVVRKSIPRSMISLAIASYLSFTPIYLIIPILALGHALQIDAVEKVYVMGIGLFTSTVGLLMLFSFAITASWQFIQSTYGTIVLFDKISPNVGLWWYLFTEMFVFFTPFYIGIFNLYQFVFIIPITLRLFEYQGANNNKQVSTPVSRIVVDEHGNVKSINPETGKVTDITGLLPKSTTTSGAVTHETEAIKRDEPSISEPLLKPTETKSHLANSDADVDSPVIGDSFLAIVLCYTWLSFTKSYPTVGDLGFAISLLPIFRSTVLPYCKYPLISGLTLLICLLLSPIFYYCWIVLGNGNSNFFYSINLIWGVVHALIMVDILWAKLTVDYIAQNKIPADKVDKLRLTQI
jgi:hypothetical protein